MWVSLKYEYSLFVLIVVLFRVVSWEPSISSCTSGVLKFNYKNTMDYYISFHMIKIYKSLSFLSPKLYHGVWWWWLVTLLWSFSKQRQAVYITVATYKWNLPMFLQDLLCWIWTWLRTPPALDSGSKELSWIYTYGGGGYTVWTYDCVNICFHTMQIPNVRTCESLMQLYHSLYKDWRNAGSLV